MKKLLMITLCFSIMIGTIPGVVFGDAEEMGEEISAAVENLLENLELPEEAHNANEESGEEETESPGDTVGNSEIYEEEPIFAFLPPSQGVRNSNSDLAIDFPDYDRSETGYEIGNDFTNNDFSIRYTNHDGTNNTVLVIDIPQVGTGIHDYRPDVNIVSSYTEVSKSKSAILLKDGISNEIAIGFTLKYRALTSEECADWVDGNIPLGNLTLSEYTLPSDVSLNDFLNHLSDYQPSKSVDYFESDISPVVGNDTSELKALQTYRVGTYPYGEAANCILGVNGCGRQVFYAENNYDLDTERSMYPVYQIQIPTVSDTMPLVELKRIKLYVPDEKLELGGIGDLEKNLIGDSQHDSCAIDLTFFDYFWNNTNKSVAWEISERKQDEDGCYFYYLTPPDGTRYFNNGTTDKTGNLTYGFRPWWKMNDSDWLPYSQTDYTYLQGKNTVFEFKTVPSGSVENFECDGPKLSVYQSVPLTDIYGMTPIAYQKSYCTRYKQVAGSKGNTAHIAAIGNASYTVTDSATQKKTYYYPTKDGTCTTVLTFPYEIRVNTIKFDDSNYTDYGRRNKGDYKLGVRTQMTSLTYTLSNGKTHQADEAYITKLNNYFSQSEPEGKIESPAFTFFGVSEEEDIYVAEVRAKWANVRIDYTMGYRCNFGNTKALSCGEDKLQGASGLDMTIGYDITETHQDGIPIQDNDKVHYGFLADFQDDSLTDIDWSEETSEYGWIGLRPKKCPAYIIYPTNPTGFRDDSGSVPADFIADGDMAYGMGYADLDIGLEGECHEYLENPQLTFSFDQKEADKKIVLTGGEGINYYTFIGGLTVTKALAGWKIRYKSVKDDTLRDYEIGDIQADTWIDYKTVLGREDDYFTYFELCYDGNYYYDRGLANSNNHITLFKEFKLLALGTNVVTGEKLGVPNGFEQYRFRIRSQATWENCNCAANLNARHKTGVNSFTAGLVFGRQLTLYSPNHSVKNPTENPHQGNSFSVDLDFDVTMKGDKDPYNESYTYFGAFSPDSGEKIPGTNIWVPAWYAPWDITEAVYVELTDDELSVDLSNCALFGYKVSDGDVEAEIVQLDGKKYLKMNFAEEHVDSIRKLVDNTSVFGKAVGIYFQSIHFCEPKKWMDFIGRDLAGTVKVAFNSFPGVTVGNHYPIGNVYLDYTELLDKYDYPNTTGTDSRNTSVNYKIEGTTDNENIGSQAATDTNKLFCYNFGKGSGTECVIHMLEQSIKGGMLFPGKNDTYDTEKPYQMKYYTEETDALCAMYSFCGDTNAACTEFFDIITLPRQGNTVKYIDSNNAVKSVENTGNFYLRGACAVENATTTSNVEIFYTTAEEPEKATSGDWISYDKISSLDAVTGIKITADKIEKGGIIQCKLLLRGDKKTNLEVTEFNAGSFCSYKTEGSSTSWYYDQCSWQYENYAASNATGYVFWDDNEDGARDTAASGVTLLLYDTDGTTLIDSAVSDKNGQFTLRSYKQDAGQKVVVVLPVDAEGEDQGYAVKMTAQSGSYLSTSGTDSDFPRTTETGAYTYTPAGAGEPVTTGITSTLTLPKLPSAGLKNLSVGFIHLPKLSVSDVTIAGGSSVSYHAQLSRWKDKPSNIWDSGFTPADAYRITYSALSDSACGTISGPNGKNAPYTETAQDQNVTLTAAEIVGSATASASVKNRLGDLITTDYQISVTQGTHYLVNYEWTGADELTEQLPVDTKLYKTAEEAMAAKDAKYCKGYISKGKDGNTYVFSGWNSGEENNKTITFSGQWKKNPGGGGEETAYTLQYETNGGTVYPQESYTAGTIVSLTKKPEKKDAVFDGWYADKALTKKLTEIKMDSNHTVYARWTTEEPTEDDSKDLLNTQEHDAYMIGYEDGNFYPNRAITRAETAAMIFRLLKSEAADLYLQTDCAFSDVKEKDWYKTYVATLSNAGIIEGYENNTFRPGQSITRAEFTVMMDRFFLADEDAVENESPFRDVSESYWARDAINRCVSRSLIEGYEDGTFRPAQSITRAEATAIMNRVLKRNPASAEALLSEMTQWPDNQDTDLWYYIDIQEASNSHDYVRNEDGTEKWTALKSTYDWKQYE